MIPCVVVVVVFQFVSYSLEQTVQFLNSVLEADPIKTVIAKEPAQNATRSPGNAAKTREKKVKAVWQNRCKSIF